MGKYLAGLMIEFPNIIAEIEAEYAAVAHGEGGPAKVAAAVAPLASLAATVANVAEGK